MKKERAFTYTEAFDQYYGGIRKVSRGALPFTCICGDRSAMDINDIWSHIREGHKEKIRNPKQKPVVTTAFL
jgi:hypothetical protein